MTIKFGYQPQINGPLANPQRIKRFAIAAEELGHDQISVTDHIVTPNKIDSRYPYNDSGIMSIKSNYDVYDVLAILGLWAGITSKIILQTSVLVLPYRNPITTAKTIASIDALSGGRLEIDVGVGWLKEEFDILNAPDFARRGKVADEYIQIFRILWTEDHPKFDGEFYKLDNFTIYPKPARRPSLPILIGGTTKPALRRAARLGDGWQALRVSPSDVAHGISAIRQEALNIGRELPSSFDISVRFGMRITKLPTERRPGEEESRVFVGTPDEVTAQIQRFVDAGATSFMLDTRFCSEGEVEETFESFAKEVLPRFN